MKNTFTKLSALIVFSLLFSFLSFSQTPGKFKYQAVLRDASGDLITGSVNISIKIYPDAVTGTPLYAETHPGVIANDQGIINIEIGSIEPLGSIDWGSGEFFLGISVNGGTELGRSQLLSVPYSEYSNTALNLTGTITESQISDLQNYISISDPVAGDLVYYNGSAWTSLPKGTTGQILTVNTAGEYLWINLFNAPTAVTLAATNVLMEVATLNGTVISNGLESTISFEYGLTTAYGNTIDATPPTAGGNEPVNVSASLSGLINNQTYHFRMKTENVLGITYGDDMSFTTLLSISIGDTYGGGIVAYIYQSGDPGYVEGEVHGMIASVNDLGAEDWYNGSNIVTGATAIALGTGAANTTTIINAQGNTNNYAAKMARDYTGGGFNDWCLPSKDEMNKLFINKTTIGNFNGTYYWTSSEQDISNAKMQRISDGFQNFSAKSTATYIVRAIRYF